MTQKTGIYKPFVKDGELWGKEVNPYGERPVFKNKFWSKIFLDQPFMNHLKKCDLWFEAEQSLQSFKVDEGEYQIIDGDFFSKTYKDGREKWVATLLTEVIQFKATIKDNTLINLEVL